MSRLAPRTLRDFLAAGYSFTASCSNYGKCTHSGTLSMPVLIQHFGWEFSIYDQRLTLIRYLRCSVCGKTHPEIRLSLIQPEKPFQPTHPAEPPMSIEESVRRYREMRELAKERDAASGLPQRPPGKGRWRQFGRR